MCDSIYMRRGRNVYFGKNSDRSPNEAHLMIRVPPRDYRDGEALKATYITIPQVGHTYGCVLLKPHWIWGAEMGWNEFGLNIGNEAVFTNIKREEQDGLIGMDLLRLALERCKTAKEALDLIISLIEQYGQGGNCGYNKKFYYDNAFLIADKNEAFVLETAGRSWIVKNADETETISNCLGLRDNYDSSSECVSGDFRKKNQNSIFTFFAGADKRKAKTFNILSESGEPFPLMMKALKSHENDSVTVNKSSTASVCMHAGNLFGDQTTGSYCGEINRIYFVTGSSFPCLSVFKPLSPDARILPEDEKIALKYWLKREILNRHIMSGNISKAEYLEKARKMQKRFISLAVEAEGNEELEAVSAKCFAEEEELVETFLQKANGKKIDIKGNLYFRNYWNKKTEELKNEYEL